MTFSKLVVLLGLGLSLVYAAADPDQSIKYEDAERTAYYSFHAGVAEHGDIPPAKPTAQQLREFSESLGYPIHDCSNEEYQCLRTWFRVVAVPRKPLAIGAAFTLDGVKLRIEECLRHSEDRCQVALISADCELMVGSDACEVYPRGRSKSPRPGPITYFIYNEDFGVTAFGTAGERAASSEQRQQVATQYILQGQAGLLKQNLSTAYR
jgi:hypothetical protein